MNRETGDVFAAIGSRDQSASLQPERGAWLALFPVTATALYYVLPPVWHDSRTVQFIPQLVAYLMLTIWLSRNRSRLARLGLTPALVPQGIRWGSLTGLILGAVNTAVILWLVPRLGFDMTFLRDTPHAHVPPLLMVPWFIVLIAIGVELNFRGFLLGRLLAFCPTSLPRTPTWLSEAGAIGSSALVFSFDPFMVATFQHLHWIAVWDGIVWGWLWVRLRNLYATITAHAVEVIVMYSVIRNFLIG